MTVIDLKQPADDPEIVLMMASQAELESVAIVGINKDGSLYVAGSLRDARLCHYLFHQGAAYLLDVPVEGDDDE